MDRIDLKTFTSDIIRQHAKEAPDFKSILKRETEAAREAAKGYAKDDLAKYLDLHADDRGVEVPEPSAPKTAFEEAYVQTVLRGCFEYDVLLRLTMGADSDRRAAEALNRLLDQAAIARQKLRERTNDEAMAEVLRLHTDGVAIAEAAAGYARSVVDLIADGVDIRKAIVEVVPAAARACTGLAATLLRDGVAGALKANVLYAAAGAEKFLSAIANVYGADGPDALMVSVGHLLQ